MIGHLIFDKQPFALIANPKFGSVQFLIKPETLDAALLAEGITLSDIPEFQDTFEEDWHLCRYRLDVESGTKVNTTVGNKDFAAAIAIGLSAAQQLVKREHSRNAGGEYHSVWCESIQSDDDLTACLNYSLGLLSSGYISTPRWTMKFRDDVVSYPRDDFEFTQQMHALKDECAKYPRFNSMNKDAKSLYSLVTTYANTSDYLKALAPKRSGYVAVNLAGQTGYCGQSLIKSRVIKSDVNLGIYQTIEDVREAHPDKNTEWIEDCRYTMVTDDILDSVMTELWNAPILSFDTETTGLKINFMSRDGLADELVGCCISGKPGTGYYFPLQHKLFANLCDGDHHAFMLKYAKKLLEEKPIVCHNLSYDWKVAYIYDININCIFDTMLAFGVTKRYEYVDFLLGLKSLCTNLFHIDMFEIEDFVIAEWKNTNITFADLPYDLVAHYGPADADITLRLYYWCLENKLLEKYNAKRVFDLEVNFSKVVAYSEFWGYHIDVDQLPALEAEITSGMNTEQAELFKIAGKEFNPNSPVQLSKIMYEEMKIPVIGTKPSTSKEVLKELGDYQDLDGNSLYPFVEHLLKYRKFETTYKNFLKKKDVYISPDGYVFPGVKQLGTNTGRVSITEPNYQSYNDVVKKRVVGRPGYYIYDCDFAQIEYRVLASMSGQDALIKAFDDPDLDYHTHQAARMFSIPYAAVTKALRQQSKGINFGLPYGMGDESLGKRVFGARTPENTAKAADLRKRFFQGQEKILEFFTRVRNDGVRNGYTETWLGRRRYYHKNLFTESAIRRQAGNHVIQGTAADIWKMAVTRFWNRIVANGWLGKVLFCGFIHDELMGECSEEIDPYEFLKAWREEYELSIDKFCKLYAGFGWGNSWYEAKKADYPPYFIGQIIAKGDEPHTWDGDYKRLITETKTDMYKYEVQRVIDWVQTQQKGTILAPHIGGYLYDKLGDWWDELSTMHQELIGTKPKAHSLDKLFHLFAEHEGFEYEDGTILPPDTDITPASGTTSEQEGEELTEEQMQQLQMDYQQRVCETVNALGFYFDPNNMLLYLKYINNTLLAEFETNYCVPVEQADVKLNLLVIDNTGTVSLIPRTVGLKLEDLMLANEFIRNTTARFGG